MNEDPPVAPEPTDAAPGGPSEADRGNRNPALAPAWAGGPGARRPPTDAALAEAVAAFDRGDHLATRRLLTRVDSESLGEPDRATSAALSAALRLDPIVGIVGAAMLVTWVVLFLRAT